MSVAISSRYSGLTPYVPGEQPRDVSRLIKLNTNESPFPPPEAVQKAAYTASQSLNLYNDTEARALSERFASHVGVSPGEVLATNGSDEILYFAYLAFGDDASPMAYPDISYGFYPVYADICRVPGRAIPLREDFTLDYRDYMGIDANVVIANPNAPTGIALPVEDIERIVRSNPNRLVLIDEAYVDFGGVSCVPLIKKYDNLLVTRTFSKSYSLAGARLGFGIACEELMGKLRAVKNSINPYNVNAMTQAAGLAALESKEYYQEMVAEVSAIRDETASRLRALGYRVLPSSTNFLFFGQGPVNGAALMGELRERGVLVRYFGGERTKDFVRMSMGTRKQMDEVVSHIREICEGRRG